MALSLEQQEHNGQLVVQVDGDVDLYSSPALREAILKAVQQNIEVLAIDLGKVAYMDSSGVATLVEGLQATGKTKKRFVLLTPSQSVLKVLQLSRLDSVFDIREAL